MRDNQNTNTITINAGNTQTETRRYFTPYGTSRGGTTPNWIDNHGYLNQPTDPATTLDLLGARNYD